MLWFLQEAISDAAARVPRGKAYRGLLHLLEGLRRTVCLFRFMRCYQEGEYVEARHKVADQVEATAVRLGLHGNGSSLLQTLEYACMDPFSIPKAIEAVFKAIPPLVAKDEAGLSPAVLALARQGTSSTRSRWVVNLGAGANAHGLQSCGEDSANCLVFGRGWKGVLFEGSQKRAAELRDALWSRRDVFVATGFARPDDFAARAMDAVFALDREAFRRREAGELFPDFLKIDTDNGDCDFLEQGLAAFTPALVEIEILQQFIPPPIRYRQRFNSAGLDSGGLYEVGAEQVFTRGCSLAAAAALLPEHRLVEFLDYNARFAHRSVLEELGLPALDPALAWKEWMEEEWDRLVLTRLGYSMFSFDLGFFRMARHKDKMGMLQAHFEEYASRERWELSAG